MNDDTTKVQLLNDYFSSVFTSTSTSSLPPLDDQIWLTDISIDVNGVFKLMQEKDASKVAGPDSIPACFLKLCSFELVPILT